MSSSNCFAHQHMTPAEYGFWQLCRDLSHKTGILYFDGRNMVKRFAGTRRNGLSKDYFYSALETLTKKGWFEQVQERRRNRSTGLWMASVHRVLSHDDWVAKHGSAQCTDAPNDDSPVGIDPNPVVTTGQANVSPVGIEGVSSR